VKKGRGVVVRQPFFYVHRFLRRCRMHKFVGKIRITIAKKHQPVAAPDVATLLPVTVYTSSLLATFVIHLSCFLYKKRDIYLVQTLTMTWLWIINQYVLIAAGEFVLHLPKDLCAGPGCTGCPLKNKVWIIWILKKSYLHLLKIWFFVLYVC